jgi:glycosyltransferase involved in cell wall biosynthesis
MDPRVSVLLPARDAEGTVEAAVESVLGQTFPHFELLALDDGSKDGTRARLEALARRDPRVRVLDAGGRGLVAALTQGLAAARAPFVARMDADDESLPARLERSVEALEAHPGWAGVGTGVEVFRDDRPPSPNLVAYGRWLSSLTSPERLFLDRFVESPLCHPSVLLRRAALEAAGGWRDGPFPEDWELWLRLLEAGPVLCCLPEVLHRWRDHDRRLTRIDPRYDFERHLDLKAGYLARGLAGRRLVVWGATDIGRGLSRRLQALGAEVAGFLELHPRKLGQRIHGAPVVRPEGLEGLGAVHVLCAVAAKGAREELRAWLQARGRLEGTDFTVVA